MLQASHKSALHVYVWHEQPRRPPSVARCLFGRPNQTETRRLLDEEMAKNSSRFANRYEICPLVKEDPRRKRNEKATSSSNNKRQKLLTDYWSKSRDTCNGKTNKKSS